MRFQENLLSGAFLYSQNPKFDTPINPDIIALSRINPSRASVTRSQELAKYQTQVKA